MQGQDVSGFRCSDRGEKGCLGRSRITKDKRDFVCPKKILN
jgi:hypothetical protein